MKMFKKICVIQTAFAGDVILATPLARALCQAFPGSEVNFLVTPETAILLSNNPFISHIYAYDKRGMELGIKSLLGWVKRLRKAEFDLALIPHRSFRSAVLAWGAGITKRVGFRNSAGSFLFTDVVAYPKDVHEVVRNSYLLRSLGWDGKIMGPELFPGQDEQNQVDDFMKKCRIGLGQRFVTMGPGSVWPTKRWLPEGFASVARQIWKKYGIHTVLVGGKEDRALGDAVVRLGRCSIINGMGELTILASAELIRRSSLLLCNDSAPLHLGVAVGTSLVAIFGPTVTEFGFAPYGEGSVVIERSLDCRPCGIHGGMRCPKKHFRCMKEITHEEVFSIIDRRLQ